MRRALPGLLATILVTLLAAGALGGCGSSSSAGTSADPAAAVPASATLYLGASVRPDGSLKSAALAAGRELLHQPNPYLRLLALLQTPGSPTLSFKRDVEPWLGKQAGIFLTSDASTSAIAPQALLGLLQPGGSGTVAAFPFGSGTAQGAIVLDSSDAAKARSFVNAQAAHAGAHASAYRGVSYQLSAGGVAFAIVKRFAVLGSDAAVHGVIDTTLGGPPLARAAGYSKLGAAAPSGALAHLYSAPSAAATAQRGATDLPRLLAGARELNLSLVPSSTSIALDADVLSSSASGGLLAAGVGGDAPLAQLPGDSWLALGLGDVGASLGEDLSALRALASLAGSSEGESSPGVSLSGLIEGLLRPLAAMAAPSAEAKRDFASWMGAGGIFASGASVFELHGAVVIDSKDPALSRAAVAKLAAKLRAAGDAAAPASVPGTEAAVDAHVRGVPLGLVIADGRDSHGQVKFVLGLGEPSVAAALHPQSTLAGAASETAAAAALGDGLRPNLIVNVPTVLSLLEGVGLTEGKALSGLLPYLRSITTVAGGVHSIGNGVERVRIVVGLRQSEG
ncbi:MAG: hypothetical protein QOI03_2384 [Solirubrobacteraceae bacterium]|nr:hypothetical protein [Solirubrobacteraceae bacterium]